MCRCFWYSLNATFGDIFIVACVFTWAPIVCACLVVVCFNVTPKTATTSLMT